MVVIAFLVGVVLTTRYLMIAKKYKQLVSQTVIRGVDLSKVANGVYFGSYDVIMVADEVMVTVRDHKITGIEIIKDVSQRGQRAEPILSRVISAQSLHVDTISGATNSSKVILKAIENALTAGTI
ncbi:MAG TPA: FMN-binding protein [Spirochaetia bacterium]|nr:FMN-binding protein [Spirochaetia bacterium]